MKINNLNLLCYRAGKSSRANTFHEVVPSRSRTPTIQNFDVEIEDTSQNPETVSTFEFWVDDTTCYILVTKLDRAYRIEQNCCFRISLMPFTCLYHLQLDGYQAGIEETIECSTCFGYFSLIKFARNSSGPNHQPNTSLFKTLLISLGEKAKLISTFKTEILSGKVVILKVEHNRLAINQYKLVLSYMLKASLDQTRHDNISSYLQLNMIPGRRNCLQSGDEPQELVNLRNQLDDIYTDLNLHENDIVLVYGAINSGKSTLVHSIINQYLSSVRKFKSTSSLITRIGSTSKSDIYYLEADPGQTEFTPCGIMSLVRLSKQVVPTPGFKYIHNSQATGLSKDDIFSKVFGATSPSGHEQHYMSIIEQLWAKYINLNEKQTSRSPLVINTMGWVEELGLKLLLNIISVVRPTRVIRVFKSENETFTFDKNLNSLPKELTTLDSFPLDVSQIQYIRQREDIPFSFYYVPSCTLTLYKSSPFKVAKIRREINQLAYMVGNLWPEIAHHPFQQIKPIR